MADGFRTIIDVAGLPHAAPYYEFFPREPSPAGAMIPDKAKTSKLRDPTLGDILDEIVKTVAPGGEVLLVCHATTNGMGLLAPLARGGFQSSADALEAIMAVDKVETAAAPVREMAHKTTNEQQAKVNAWIQLFRANGIVNVIGTLTLAEAEKAYHDWLSDRARKVLGVPTAALVDLLKKMRAVRALNLKRLEFRACTLGTFASTLSTFKKFFGTADLLAPAAETFYLPKFEITAVRDPTYFRYWLPPAREKVKVVDDKHVPHVVSIRSMESKGKRRVFQDKFVFLLVELTRFHYTAAGAGLLPKGWTPPKFGPKVSDTAEFLDVAPDWPQVRAFVQRFLMPGSTYTEGKFPIAGFWTPGAKAGPPFVLPGEAEYLAIIKKAK